MKKLMLSASFAFALLTTTNTFAQQGFGTNQPDKSAAVDIVSSKRGLLIPRIDITNLNNADPVSNPATSLFVYNTNTTSGEGFYYWDGTKWVRFTSTNNERDVIVQAAPNGNIDIPAATYDANGVKTYNVSVKGGEEGQVLVSNATGGTEWTDPNTFVLDVLTAGNAIGIAADPIDPTKVEVKFNGTLSENTTIATGSHDLAITGLETVNAMTADDKLVIMDENGLLKTISKTDLVDAKDLTLGDGLTFEAGDGVGAVLKATKIEIEDNSVTAVKLDAKGETEGYVATVNNDGTVTYQAITPASLIDKKTLTGDGITVTAGTTVGTDSSVADALLADVTLGIANGAVTTAKLADGAVTNQKLADGAVSSDKMTSFTDDNGTTAPVAAGHVPVADGSGNVTYQAITPASLTDKKTLTTDGVIVIGADSDATATTAAESVLADVKLNIGKDKITANHIATGAVTSDEILDGTITTEDIESTGNSKVLVTAADGTVTWIDQSALANKDSYTGIGAIDIIASGNSTNGINYDVSVATATGATLGVVKEVVTDPTVNINAAGELSVNLDNTILIGDVTGSLNATKVEAIQGTAVSATPPTATNNVLKYDGTAWTPAQLQGTDVAGKAITSTSLTVSADGATAALKDVTIDITPGTEGQILTTVGAAGAETTAWTTVNSLVEADNGLNKNDTTDKIHLGGALKEVTEIAASADHTLAISGLQPATEGATNKVVVSEGATGILRTVERVVEGTNVNVEDNTGYSFFTPEVVINVTLADADQTIEFPAPASAVGQVINIKIANKTESHTGYLNVLDTYGSMPYQGWIVKSNGSDWVIVGRN